VQNKEIAATARRTIDVLIDRGWTQGKNESDNGEVCAVKGLALALNVTPVMNVLKHPAYFALLDYIEELDGVRYVGVTFWNDKPERTASEVIETFLEFAKKIEGQGGG
jgi:hypothetical protein